MGARSEGSMDGVRAPSLLAIFAHPDDESIACGGLLARCFEAGIRTSLLCLTRGARGPGAEGALGGARAEGLSDVRAEELAAAARELGVADVVLLDHEDGMLRWIEAADLEADIARTIRAFDPEVVVTFDEDGLYWHPDHIAVHERVTAVVSGMGHGAPALFYVSVPEGSIRALVDAASSDPRCGEGVSASVLGIEDVDAFGSEAPAPSLAVDAGSCAVRKVRAIRCHRSQVAGTTLECVDEEVAARLLAIESYRRASVGRSGETPLDRLGTNVVTAGS